MLNGVEELSLEELEKLFDDDGTQDPPPANGTAETDASSVGDGTNSGNGQETGSNDTKKDATKAFAKRLKESTEKAVNEEREAIAKSMGYNSYAEMVEKREKELIESKGLDPDEVAPVVSELLEQRLANDPRMKELETLRRKQVEEFGKKELAEITELTGGEITKLSQLPREVIDLWKQKGSLKSAYMELEGEKLITKIRSEQSKGSTSHLNGLSGGAGIPNDKRPLTKDEKEIWKLFNPSITEEELNKKLVDN